MITPQILLILPLSDVLLLQHLAKEAATCLIASNEPAAADCAEAGNRLRDAIKAYQQILSESQGGSAAPTK